MFVNYTKKIQLFNSRNIFNNVKNKTSNDRVLKLRMQFLPGKLNINANLQFKIGKPNTNMKY